MGFKCCKVRFYMDLGSLSRSCTIQRLHQLSLNTSFWTMKLDVHWSVKQNKFSIKRIIITNISTIETVLFTKSTKLTNNNKTMIFVSLYVKYKSWQVKTKKIISRSQIGNNGHVRLIFYLTSFWEVTTWKYNFCMCIHH